MMVLLSLLSVVSCVLVVALKGSVLATSLPESEMDALHDLFLATNGENWDCLYTWGNPWNFTDGSDPCEDDWVGVNCNIDADQQYYYVSQLLIDHCELLGTIPDTIYKLTNLSDLVLAANMLYGTVPYSIADMDHLQVLSLGGNLLSGTIPVEFSRMSGLETLSMDGNLLSGDMSSAFDPTKQTSLYIVYLEYNRFTGSLPITLLSNPNLETVHLDHNCFHGTIPDEICQAENLLQIEFTCLSCNSRCIHRLVEQSNFLVSHAVHGSLPSCLFRLPHINDFYLGYNHFSGTLPSELLAFPSPVVETVDLSYNRISGNLPAGFMEFLTRPDLPGNTHQLFLSNNLFTGGLNNDAAVNEYADFDFTHNRFSGPPVGANWPQHLGPILTGNIFSCRIDRSDLPSGDEAYERYQCGSDAVNNPLIAWLVLTSVVVVGVGVAGWKVSETNEVVADVLKNLRRWLGAVQGLQADVGNPALTSLWRVTSTLCTTAGLMTLVLVVLVLPVYVVLSHYYGTYRHQYAWALSAALLSGRVPFALCLVVFVLVLGLAVMLLFRGVFRLNLPEVVGAHVKKDQQGRTMRVTLACAGYIMVNFVVVGMVNVAFVAISEYTTPVYQLAISVFKVGWNVLVSPFLSRRLAYELSAARADWFTLELFVSIMNNIGIPLLAVVFVSPECLFNLLGGGIAKVSNAALDNYDTPFYYSYQCSYVYLDYYAATFVYLCLWTSFGMPLLEQTAQWLLLRAAPGSCWHQMLFTPLPRILKPVETDASLVPDRNILRPYFDATQFLVTQLTYLALLLTMGVVFPPLAVTLVGAMVASALYALLKVGRLLCNAHDLRVRKYATIIAEECAGAAYPKSLKRAFWMLLWFACWFYTLFLFDTLGDAVGFAAACWVLIVMPLLPVVFWLCSYLVPTEVWGNSAAMKTVPRSARALSDDRDREDQSPLKSFIAVDDVLGLSESTSLGAVEVENSEVYNRLLA